MSWGRKSCGLAAAAVAVTVVLVLSGCGGGSDKKSDSSSSDSNSSASKLSAALLTPTDLPAGYNQVDNPPDSKVVSTSNQECSHIFSDNPGEGLGNVGKPSAEEARTFNDDSGDTLGNVVSEYSDTTAGAKLIAQLQAATARCRAWSEKDEGGSVTAFTLQSRPAPGPNSYRVLITAQVQGDPAQRLSGDSVVVTKGGHVAQVVRGSEQGAALSDQIIQTVSNKLNALG
ncbi:MAG: hypothetical protein ACRD3Q_01865 [Terriglobales bacterium]